MFDIARFPVEIAAPRAYWLEQPFVQSGGPMVIDPRRLFYSRDFSEPMNASVGEAWQFPAIAVVVKTNEIPFWGRCTTHFGADWDVHRGMGF